MKSLAFTRLHAIRDAHGLRPAEKSVLFSLALFAGPNPTCWPSQTKLATGGGLTRPRCNEVIASLVAKGIVQTTDRFLKGTRARTSSEYHIDYEALARVSAAKQRRKKSEQPLSPNRTTVVPESDGAVVPKGNTKRSGSEETNEKIREGIITAPSVRPPSSLSDEDQLLCADAEARALQVRADQARRRAEEIRKALAKEASKDGHSPIGAPAPASAVSLAQAVPMPGGTAAQGCSETEQRQAWALRVAIAEAEEDAEQ